MHRGRLARKGTEEAKKAKASETGLSVMGASMGSNSTVQNSEAFPKAALQAKNFEPMGSNSTTHAAGFKAPPPKAAPPSAKRPGKPTPQNGKAKAAAQQHGGVVM